MPIPSQTGADAPAAVPAASGSGCGRKPGAPEPDAPERKRLRNRKTPEAGRPGTRMLATGPPRRPGSLRMPDGSARMPVAPGMPTHPETGGRACRRAGAHAPPLCLVGCGAGKQAVLLAPGSSLPGPSHRGFAAVASSGSLPVVSGGTASDFHRTSLLSSAEHLFSVRYSVFIFQS